MRAPAYHQLNDRLRRLATSGDLSPGARFPTERELATRFGVSRVTANKALSQLVVEGLLEFRPGVGTFVRKSGLDHDIGSLMSFTRAAELSGKRPSTRVVRFRKTRSSEAPERVRQELRCDPDDEVFAFVRVRLADDVPVILESRHLKVSACPGLTRQTAAGSLYELLRNQPGLTITGAEQTLHAVNLEAADAKMLGVAAGTAALLIHAVGFGNGLPIWTEDTLYRGDRYEFQNTITTGRDLKPARVAPLSEPPSLPSSISPHTS
jgi:GntR family transcriptional regulator